MMKAIFLPFALILIFIFSSCNQLGLAPVENQTAQKSLTPSETFNPTIIQNSPTPMDSSSPSPTPSLNQSFADLPSGTYLTIISSKQDVPLNEMATKMVLDIYSSTDFQEVKSVLIQVGNYYSSPDGLRFNGFPHGPKDATIGFSFIDFKNSFSYDFRTQTTQIVPYIPYEMKCVDAALSPDNSKMIVSCAQGEYGNLYVVSSLDQTPIQIADCQAFFMACGWTAWSPDGQRILYFIANVKSGHSDREGFYEFKITCPEATSQCLNPKFAKGPLDGGPDAGWSADGSLFALPNGNAIDIYNSQGAMVKRISTDMDELIYGVAWSPDGTKLAFITGHDNIYVISLHDSTVEPVYVNSGVALSGWIVKP